MTASDTKKPRVAEEPLESIDIKRIMELLPHRYPMLMIDRIEDVKLGISATGIKNVTFNEPFFLGHFPGHPIMPGVLIVEAMAQTAGALVKHSLGTERGDEVVYFMTIDKAKFRKPVVPGDTLKLHVNLIRERAPVWRFAGEARVNGELRAEAEFSAMIMGAASEPPRES
ncbi:MAG: 3-hydroxyacyl-ACP dehydratase FabZ [Alphaproteobacteria bacterium]